MEPFENSLDLKESFQSLLAGKHFDLLLGCQDEHELTSKYKFLDGKELPWISCASNKSMEENDCKFVSEELLSYYDELLSYNQFPEAFNLGKSYKDLESAGKLRCKIDGASEWKAFAYNCIHDMTVMYSHNLKVLSDEKELHSLSTDIQTIAQFEMSRMTESEEKLKLLEILSDLNSNEKLILNQKDTCLPKVSITAPRDYFDDRAMASLALVIKKGLIVHELDLSDRYFTDVGLIELVTVLDSYSMLETLIFSGNSEITSKGWTAIAELLRSTNSHLTKVIIDDIVLDSASIEVISSAVAKNTKLRELSLDGTKTSGSSLRYLCDSIQLNQGLEKLSLAVNEISSDDMTAMAGCFKNTGLKELVLRGNPISDQGIDALATTISTQITSTLQILDVSSTQLTDNAIESIRTILSHSPNLEYFALEDNEITSRGKQRLREGLPTLLDPRDFQIKFGLEEDL